MAANRFSAILFILFSLLITALPYQCQAKGISDNTAHSMFCQQAIEDDNLFANFKQNLEHITFEDGLEYLKTIQKDYPDLLKYITLFKQNDSIGNPKTYFYNGIGEISPTTLRYIKVAGDLQRAFGDKLKSMHIVEIGCGYGGQCKILSDLGAFASYTMIDIPSCNALSRKYLSELGVPNVSYIDSSDLQSAGQYDLVISNYAFSEMDRKAQKEYLERIVLPSPYGYMTLSFISDRVKIDSYTLSEIVIDFYNSNKKGMIQTERPLTQPTNVICIWTPLSESRPSIVKQKKELFFEPESKRVKQSAITYDFSGGRLGDNLVSYFHAKWLAREFELPFLYKSFQFSNYFMLSELDQYFSNELIFAHGIRIGSKYQAKNTAESTLITVPYFPESVCEYDFAHVRDSFHYYVDWEDPLFKKEVIDCLQPKNPLKIPSIPPGYISVAVHVRRGGAFEDSSVGQRNDPQKFPPDNYYTSQLQFISELFKDQPIYVYIFTDDLQPEVIAKNYAAAIKNPNAVFDWNKNRNVGSDINEILSDFYFMGKFDCLIRSASNFSIMSSQLGDYAFIIAPGHRTQVNNEPFIDNFEIKFKTKRLLKMWYDF